MPRITAGKAKGLKLKVLESKTRPITDRIKISVFDTLSEVIEGANVLDLFAGSGSIGIEAVSRGASTAVLVEIEERAVKLIQENLSKVDFNDQITVLNQNVEDFLRETDQKFDIIFVDPPFWFDRKDKLRQLKSSLKKVSETGVVVFRYLKSEKYPLEIAEFQEVLKKKYGKSCISYYQINKS